ncbi:alpha/beta fold hydrolase [Streptomyces sp. NBC_00663]|uniref:alpha/beta fold hydrolase n=1 Tax=Streptomyces sp. NBC_00663 TaxID=2975801 RepID=UPI002E338957|nr:alpha/beta fold hydrolase [Streptomyces sp. NBC_00663]
MGRRGADAACAGLRTMSFSAYGRGYSDRAQGQYDEAMFVRQLRELLSFLGIDTPVNLVGTSMGALGAMAYLLDRSETVRTLTLIGPAGLSTDTALQQRALKANPIASFAARRFGRKILLGHLGRNVSDPALVEPLTSMISDCYRFEGSMYCFFSTLQNYPISGREDLYRRTGSLGIPILLAWGTEDQVTPISGFDRARDLVRPTRTEIIEACGHMAPSPPPLSRWPSFPSRSTGWWRRASSPARPRRSRRAWTRPCHRRSMSVASPS